MPELPEVETVRRGIAPEIIGRRIVAVFVRQRRLRRLVPAGLGKKITGMSVVGVYRRAKYLIIVLDSCALLVHLGMSGALRVGASPSKAKHEHIDWALDNGKHLLYSDPRRFGLVLLAEKNFAKHPLLEHLGCEPLTRNFNGRVLYAAWRGKKMPVKTALLDGKTVAGVGNIYASESLFDACIRPQTAAGKISAKRCAVLAVAIKSVLRRAIRAGGSTLRDFVDGHGHPGMFQMKWRVYGRGGSHCCCGAVIRKIFQNGRATYYCPRCQR